MKAVIFLVLFALAVSKGYAQGQGYFAQRHTPPSTIIPPAIRNTNELELEILKTFDGNKNYFLSPASIKITLGILLAGAKGRSANEISQALKITESEELQTLLQVLKANTQYTKVEAANAAFIASGLSITQKFRQTLQTYKADFTEVNFSNGASVANTINNWVNGATHGLIPNIATPGQFNADSELVLANALYFKGQWKKIFDEGSTSIKCFHRSDGKCINAKMMHSIDDFGYKALSGDLDAQALQLPYRDEKYAMLVLLPNEKQTVEGLTQALQNYKFNSITKNLQTIKVYVNLPKFEIDYSADIGSILKEVGIKEIFSNNADLQGIAHGKELKVSKIIHKAKVEVNEKGTTAAAATEVDVVDLIGSSMPHFVADRPFLFFIYHIESNTVLFEGRFNEPHEVYDDIFIKS